MVHLSKKYFLYIILFWFLQVAAEVGPETVSRSAEEILLLPPLNKK